MEHIIHDESNNSKEVYKFCQMRIYSKLSFWPQGRKGWLRKSGLRPKTVKYSRGLMAWDLKRRGAGARSVSTRSSFIIRRSKQVTLTILH